MSALRPDQRAGRVIETLIEQIINGTGGVVVVLLLMWWSERQDKKRLQDTVDKTSDVLSDINKGLSLLIDRQTR